MNKIFIVQSYNTTESDIYNVDPDYIENIVCNSLTEAEKIRDFIDDYNENLTGVEDQINSRAKIIEIDLNSFETLKSVKKRMEG